MPHNTSLRGGSMVLAAIFVVGLLAPWLAPYDPTEQIDAVAGKHRPPLTVMPAIHFADRGWKLAERVERTPEGLVVYNLGSHRQYGASTILNLDEDGVRDQRVFLLGTDKFGRDVLSRLVHGARVSLLIGILSVILALTIGVTVGALAALGGRWLDNLLMRFVDGMLTIPWIFLLIALTALFVTDTWMLILLLGGTVWPTISRLTRAELMGLRNRDFVLAARGLGLTEVGILFRHMLPNAMTPLMVSATLTVGNLILVESSLSFIGFGVQPPNASWGNMIADGQGVLLTQWWVAGFPTAALVITVVAINLVGEGLRDVLDPRNAQQVGT
ncbi:MAG: ABC transporter permease [Acidobacteriota bacterium]